MKKYKQLDFKDRHKIKALLDGGHCQTNIAEIIGVHKSTISRELSRNVASRGRYAKEYRPQLAHRKTSQRHTNKRKCIRFTEDLKEDAIEGLTNEKLSPELISGRWEVMGIDGVSHEAIYQWVWQGKRQKDPIISFPSFTNILGMVGDNAKEDIITIPGVFLKLAYLLKSAQRWSKSAPALEIWRVTLW